MNTLAFLVVVAAMGLAVAWATAALVYPAWSRFAQRSPRQRRTVYALRPRLSVMSCRWNRSGPSHNMTRGF